LIDPVGFGFVITEYLNALGLSFFSPLSLLSGALVSAFEFVLGVSLLLGLQLRLTSLFTMLFMAFFTLLTLWTALFNPVQHCGCFGDAIILSNTETFLKNLIFFPFSILLFIRRKQFAPISLNIREWSTIALFGFAALLLSLHGYRHLPLIDFTGFKVGNHIPEAMTVPDDAPRNQYETIFTYQKEAKTKKFSLDNLPDSSWTYVSHKTKLIKAGAIPAIPHFDISAYSDNRYVTDSLLSIRGWVLFFTIPHVDKGHEKAFKKAGALYRQITEQSAIPFITISGSGEAATQSLLHQYGVTSPLFFSDPKSVYTMVRTNPGLMLLYDASVVAKWSNIDIPSYQALERILVQDWEIVSAKARIKEKLSVEFFALFLILLLGGLHLTFRHLSKKKR